jgi:hypothetical protein
MSDTNDTGKMSLDPDTLSKLSEISRRYTENFPSASTSRIAPGSSAFEYTDYHGKLPLFVDSESVVTVCDMTANNADQSIKWSALVSKTPTAIGPGTPSASGAQELVTKYVSMMAEFCQAVRLAYSTTTEEWWTAANYDEKSFVIEVYSHMDQI